MKSLSIIAAMSSNRVIGRNNQLPWHLRDDLKRFKALTMGKSIIMGRGTFESIGKALPGRTNIIVTRNKQYIASGCHVVHSLDQAFLVASDEVIIIGGESLFRQCLPTAERLYLTLVLTVIEGDTYFPEFDESQWMEVERREHPQDEHNQFATVFRVLQRK